MSVTIPPGESIEVPVELTQEAIKAINNGERIKLTAVIHIPWLDTWYVKYSVLFLATFGLWTLISDIVEIIFECLK